MSKSTSTPAAASLQAALTVARSHANRSRHVARRGGSTIEIPYDVWVQLRTSAEAAVDQLKLAGAEVDLSALAGGVAIADGQVLVLHTRRRLSLQEQHNLADHIRPALARRKIDVVLLPHEIDAEARAWKDMPPAVPAGQCQWPRETCSCPGTPCGPPPAAPGLGISETGSRAPALEAAPRDRKRWRRRLVGWL